MADNVTVDFTHVVTATDPLGVGIVITEFGGNPVPIVGDTAWFNLLKSLAPGHLRCSIAWYGGNPGYGAGGSPGQQGSGGSSAVALINAIKATGAVPLVSYNGNSSDNGSLNGADAGSLVHFFNDNGGQNGGPVKYWSVGNEPDNTGGVGPYESEAPACVTAMVAASSGVVVGVPAAAYWDVSLLEWAAGVGGVGALSYHAYDALDAPGSDNGGGGFYNTSEYYKQTGTLRSLKGGLLYGVEELNANANAGSSTTLAFTTSWKETAWIADVLGQLLSSGAHGTVYGDSNSALSVISDGSGGLPAHGTPMPAYWGLGIWTGMNGAFKRYSANMVSASTSLPDTSVSVYACDNGKIILVNKATSPVALTIGVTLPGGVTNSTYNVNITDAGNPTGAITQVVTGAAFTGGTISYTIPASTTASLDVSVSGSSSSSAPSWDTSGEYTLILDDEFNGTLNTALWQPGWFGGGITGPINSAETAAYSSANVSVSGGNLNLLLTATSITAPSGTYPHTGACVSSNPHDGRPSGGFEFTYGSVEWRAYLPPAGTSIANWPALWMDGQTWPADGEFDVMEGLSGTAQWHIPTAGNPGGGGPGTYYGWHQFGVRWLSNGSVTFYYDGVAVSSGLTAPNTAPMYLIMDNTQGSYGGTGVFPATMLVDWVRVWQPTVAPMSAPPGYGTKIFEDQFTGTTLNASNWVTYLGEQGSRSSNSGLLPSPYSGPDTPGNDNVAMFGPAQVTVGNGCTLTAQVNTNTYDGTYPWISGIISTEGLFSMPTNSAWYVQVNAKMPDMSTGMWPAISFLPGTGSGASNEIDLFGGGYTGGSGSVNDQLHFGFSAPQGQQSHGPVNSGVDLTAGYNVYGMAFIPGVSITGYFNGTQMWQVLASSGITIAAEPYEIIIDLQVAGSNASGFHTTESGGTPTSTMEIAEVQVWIPSSGASGTLTQVGGVPGQQFQYATTGPYLFQLNEWDSLQPYSCNYSYSASTPPIAGFSVVSSQIANATNGPPGGYSSMISGNHAVGSPNYVSPVNTQFPIQNSAITLGEVTTSVTGNVVSSGAWDYAYDIWFSTTANPVSGVGNNGSGLEMMIWLNHFGGVQPAGSPGATVVLDGIAWTAWVSPSGPISYVANTLITSVTDLDLLPFINDAISRGLMTSAWYLIDVECGFEIWNGGNGLTITDFVCSNGVTATPPPPPPFVVGLPSVPGLSVPGLTSPGQPLFISGVSSFSAVLPSVRTSLAGTVSGQGAVINSVQSNTGFTFGATSVTVTLPVGVTLGNLIVVCLAAHQSGLTVTPPSGWAQAGGGASLGGTLQTQIYYLVVGGGQAGETSFTFGYSSSVTQAATIREWHSSSGWKASPVDKTTSNAVFGSGTVSAGTSGATSAATELAVAALSWGNTGQTESALTTGYTSGGLAVSSGSCSVREVYQVLSTSGAQACQETVSGSQNTIGFLATFEPTVVYTEFFGTSTAVAGYLTRRVSRNVTGTGVAAARSFRRIPRSVSAFTSVASHAPRNIGRYLRGLLAGKAAVAEPDIGYTVFGPLHIVFPGGGRTVSDFIQVFPSPRVSLTAVLAFARSLPRPLVTIAGRVYHSAVDIILPSPTTTLTGIDTHNVLNPAIPTPGVSLIGVITRRGALSIALSSRQVGFLYREGVLSPDDLIPATWLTGQVKKRWRGSLPATGWSIVSYGMVQLSHLSTEYVLVPVAASRSGASYNPTADAVQFAFMPNAIQQPVNADWVSGSWDTDSSNILYPYSAKCLVGPGGVITLVPGTYVIYVEITDSPEIPVLVGGQLTVN